MLELRNLKFGFPNKILGDSINLEFCPGKVCCLMGGNGAGKTTLFNVISGFIKPISGQILLQDNDIGAIKPFGRNRLGIGRTFQDLRLIKSLTVQENVMLAMKDNPTDLWHTGLLPVKNKKVRMQHLRSEVPVILEQFYLDKVPTVAAGSLSYGQQKLLTLACVTANRSTVLLLDEPISGINQEYQQKISGLIAELKKTDRIILLIEHNADFIETVGDEIYFLLKGKLKHFSKLTELRRDPEIIESYIHA